MISIRERGKIGVGLFILSEVNFFLLLIIAYVYYHAYPGRDRPRRPRSIPMRTGMFSLALFASSATIMDGLARGAPRRSRGLVRGSRSRSRSARCSCSGRRPSTTTSSPAASAVSRNLFATTFFTLTGFHGLHVIIGLVALMRHARPRARRQTARARRSDGFGAVEWYWHFVDAVWVVVFSIVYLWGAVAS